MQRAVTHRSSESAVSGTVGSNGMFPGLFNDRNSEKEGEANMTTLNLATFCERAEDGSIDVDATVLKFEGELLKYQVERETELATIGAAVHGVFDSHKGTTINMPAVVTMALQSLNVQPATYAALSERVATFVRDNASDKREDGRSFRIAKGKGGGVSRWCDVVDKPAK